MDATQPRVFAFSRPYGSMKDVVIVDEDARPIPGLGFRVHTDAEAETEVARQANRHGFRIVECQTHPSGAARWLAVVAAATPSTRCSACGGLGKITLLTSVVACDDCGGTGFVSSEPFSPSGSRWLG